jgi:hypothetical protein
MHVNSFDAHAHVQGLSNRVISSFSAEILWEKRIPGDTRRKESETGQLVEELRLLKQNGKAGDNNKALAITLGIRHNNYNILKVGGHFVRPITRISG